MRAPSVKTARRVLIGVIVLTLASVVFNYLQTWYRRSRQVLKVPQILDSEMKRSAKDVDYFEYRGAPRVLRFKIHAKNLLEKQSGKNLLEGIEACDFNPDGSVRNEIRSQTAEYDPVAKTADFSGDVRLFVNRQLELRTNSLHYDLNTGIGTTPDLMRFYSEQISGTARGVRFEQDQQSLELQSEVDLTLVQAKVQKTAAVKARKVRATARRAYCSEKNGRILLEGNARLVSENQTLSGEHIEAMLDSEHKRIRSLTAEGSGLYASATPEESRSLGGDRLVFGIGRSGVLQNISVSGKASFSSSSSADVQNLRGGEIVVDFDLKELPTAIKARENVQFEMQRGDQQTTMSGNELDAAFFAGAKYLNSVRIRKGQSAEPAKMHMNTKGQQGSELQAEDIRMILRDTGGRSVLEKLRAEGSAKYVALPAGAHEDSQPARSLSASVLEMIQSAKGDSLESGSASGKVVFSEEANGRALRSQVKKVTADRAGFQFYPGNNALRHLDANGNVQVTYVKQQRGPFGPAAGSFQTRSEQMKAEFGLEDGKSTVQSVAQWGNFTYDDGLKTASAGRCDYDAGKEMLVLTDSPRIADQTMETTGERVEYDQPGHVLSVRGNVRSRFYGSRKNGSSFFASKSSSSPGIVKADEMKYWTEEDRVSYAGHVHLQAENQNLRAATLKISDNMDRVEAEGSVRHEIARKEPAGASVSAKKQKADDFLTVIRSASMNYSKEKNLLVYSGKATLHSKDVDLESEILNAVPDPDGTKLKQAAARGKVAMTYGSRSFKGDEADYFPESGKLVVTGNPAEFFDPAKGRSFARRLTSTSADDTILLEK